MIGKVKTLTDKGYGFISMGAGHKDLFFHANSLRGMHFTELAVGDALEFDVEEGDKGPHATNVDRADDEAA